ncbi:hypothetical protein DFH08DRAFT_135444 [Mycena albidolilacea]|uniref:RBR-type E3 ubiquitin transferase n=1 Tax=Mycena albidolilacea TaxID=1033008 RepID=A0AAD7ESB2_9AGAR|nr:hypothetical protein DFH08DRAFT_135444 [Mycena albidolilacea]
MPQSPKKRDPPPFLRPSIPVSPTDHSQADRPGRSLPVPQTRPRPKRGEIPCHAWRDGHCPKGAKCWYAHDPQVQEDERLRRERAARVTEQRAQEEERLRREHAARIEEQRVQEEERLRREREHAARLAEQLVREEERLRRERENAARAAEQRALEMERQRTARLARLAEQEAAERARQIEIEARKAETRRKEAAHTTQHIVLGTSLVTYNAGISVQEIVTGFEACRIQIKNLPRDATHDEIKALFTQQGVDQTRIFITGTKELPDGRLEATLITSAEEGGAIAAGLEDIEFRQERLHFEVAENTTSGGMGNSAKDSDTLTLSWRAPSSSVVVTFDTIGEAADKVERLNRQMCAGRRVRVQMNQPPPGRMRDVTWQRTVKITGLPDAVSPQTVTEFTGSYSLRFLKPISYNIDGGLMLLRQNMERVAGRDSLKSFDVITRDNIEGNMTVKARFETWEAAKGVRDSLAQTGRVDYLGGCSLRLWLPDPLQYIISIPLRQYQAQKRVWDSLAGSDGASNQTAYIRIFSTGNARMQIKVLGDDKKAVGSLKVRVENLVTGERLSVSCWHRSLTTAAGSRFLDSVFDRTGAYTRADWKLRVVKVYGDAASVDRARDVVQAEVDRLDSLEWSVFLKKESIRFFVQRGIAALKEALGDGNATLVISPRVCKIVIKGGEDARHLLTRLMDESLEGAGGVQRTITGASCPICYDEIAHPVTLGCDHAYCMGCLRHYLSTAADTFPLACLGNEATCETPIPIPTIERFLPASQFQQLLEMAFLRHVEQHPQEFKYCKTPDCSQVYRRSALATAVTCPSCFFVVCSSCDEEAHEGMSCEEKRVQSDPGEQERRNDEWARANGVKRCPTCAVWIEKTEGCNHMTCKCGAHLCWICVRVFDEDQIYAHLRSAHGGFFDVPPAQPAPAAAPEPAPAQRWLRYGQADPFAEQARQEELRLQEQALDYYRRLAIVQEARRQEEAVRRQEAAHRQEVARRQEAARRRQADEQEVRQRMLYQQRQAAVVAAPRERRENGWGCTIM